MLVVASASPIAVNDFDKDKAEQVVGDVVNALYMLKCAYDCHGRDEEGQTFLDLIKCKYGCLRAC
jgi:hypothetical protein